MSIECGECERDLRGGHDPSCSRYEAEVERRITEAVAAEREACAKLAASMIGVTRHGIAAAIRARGETTPEWKITATGDVTNGGKFSK